MKYRLLVFLQIAAVTERSAFDHCKQRRVVAQQTRRFATDQFHGIGIFLLRHHRRATAKRIVQSKESKFCRAPVHKIFCIATQRRSNDRKVSHEFKRHIAMGNGIDTIRGNTREAKLLGH